jgi:hypothetical protein
LSYLPSISRIIRHIHHQNHPNHPHSHHHHKGHHHPHQDNSEVAILNEQVNQLKKQVHILNEEIRRNHNDQSSSLSQKLTDIRTKIDNKVMEMKEKYK